VIRHTDALFQDKDFFPLLLDSMPLPVFVVDDDVRIHSVNLAATRHVGASAKRAYLKRGGEILECLHATEAPGGCGCSKACKGCPMRESAARAVKGHATHRRHVTMQLHVGGDVRDVHLLITATPLARGTDRLALLILEDISELIQLRSLLPICASCKKIRNGHAYWEEIEQYFHDRLDISFSHGLCPDCLSEIHTGGNKIGSHTKP